MRRIRVLIALALVLVPASVLHAQVTTATFVGLVHDSSGAVVPGATVVATHQGTGVPRGGDYRRARRVRSLCAAERVVFDTNRIDRLQESHQSGHRARRGPDRAPDVRARARRGRGNRHRRRARRRSSKQPRRGVRDVRHAGSARAAGQPAERGEPAEPRPRRVGRRVRRRHGEHERRRRWRHGDQRGRHRGELRTRRVARSITTAVRTRSRS